MMKKGIFFLVMMGLFLTPIKSATLLMGGVEISEGLVFNAVISFSEEERAKINDINELSGKFLFEKIYIVELVKGSSTDTQRVNFKGVILRPLTGDERGILEINGEKILLRLKDVHFVENGLRPQKSLLLYELSDGIIKKINQWAVYLYILASIFIIFCCFKWFRKYKIKSAIKEIKQDEVDFWREQMAKACERHDFEHIYVKRRLWKNILNIDNRESKIFFKKLNSIQYKKEWNLEEKKEINLIFTSLKNKVLEKNGI